MLSLKKTSVTIAGSVRLVEHEACGTSVRAVVMAGKTTKQPFGFGVTQFPTAVCGYGCLTGSGTFLTSMASAATAMPEVKMVLANSAINDWSLNEKSL
jgi:hypothetical protein